MFGTKFEIAVKMTWPSPLSPKREEGDLLQLHRWPETDPCREGMHEYASAHRPQCIFTSVPTLTEVAV
jgi:hypothetical protein